MKDTRQVSKHQSLEPAVCWVQIYYVRDLVVVYLQSLSTDITFFLYSFVMQRGSLQITFQKHFAPTAYLVKNPPAMQETLVQLQGWEDPKEKG